MKYAIPVAALCAVLTASTLAQDPAPDALGIEQRVEQLEKALVVARTEREQLSKELDLQRKLLAETQAYLHKQAEDAAGLLKVFGEAEAAGFLWGEGYKSREILLHGLRAFMQSAQKGLPSAKAESKPDSKAMSVAPGRERAAR